MSELSTTNNMKPITKFQKIGILTITGIIAIFAFAALIFGPNDMRTVGETEIIEQARQEKLNYILVQTTSNNGQILELSLDNDAMAQVRLEVLKSEDPASIDIEARVKAMLGL